MPRVFINLASTALSGASYDPDTRTLDVDFTGGGTYTHEGVPQTVFEGLRDSPSPGRFYHAEIKGRY